MSQSPEVRLSVAIRRRVHPSLMIDVAFELTSELGVLFGPSGAGKTTVLRMIAGLESPDEGRITAAGSPFFDSDRRLNRRLRDRQVGYVFQHDVLFPHLDVEANLRYGLKGQAPAAMTARVAEVCDLFGIGSLKRRRVETLSGGERQRVGLARAVAPRPRILLCDEPVSALDLDARYQILSRLREIQQGESLPILLVTHAVDEALSFGDRLFLLDAGQIVATGPPHSILSELSARSYLHAARLQNVFAGVISHHDPARRSTDVLLAGGPALTIPEVDQAVGTRVLVRVDSEEIVLARGLVGALSARNLIGGIVDRIIVHDTSAEVVVRVGDLTWFVGIIEPTIQSMGLTIGEEIQMIIKARICHLLIEPSGRAAGPGSRPSRT